jgi:hypothetical protein
MMRYAPNPWTKLLMRSKMKGMLKAGHELPRRDTEEARG